MRRLYFSCIITFGCLCVMGSAVLADIVIDDGLSHDFNYSVDENVLFYDGPSGSSTGINVYDGAAFSERVSFYDNSVFNMYDGEMTGSVYVHDNSVANITGGYIRFCDFKSDSVATVSGNASIGGSHFTGGSVTVSENATVGPIIMLDALDVTMQDGTFTGNIVGGCENIDISGGDFSGIISISPDNASIKGGTFHNLVVCEADYIVSGGIFDFGLRVSSDRCSTFVGSDFAINGVPVEPGTKVDSFDDLFVQGPIVWQTANLTGTFADGSEIDMPIYLFDYNNMTCGSSGNNSSSILFIPEPSSMLIILAGCGSLLRKKSH